MHLRELFELLRDHVDAGVWWPADTRFEICVGAVLTQNTAWTNVETAIAQLKAAGALSPEVLIHINPEKLHQLIRPSGYYNTKAEYLTEISSWFLVHAAEAETMTTQELRTSLLHVRGIGPETADDILLYAYRRPVFVWDLYARRLFAAAGLGSFSTYEQARAALDYRLVEEAFSVDELALFHGLVVEAGKQARAAGGWDVFYPQLLAAPGSS